LFGQAQFAGFVGLFGILVAILLLAVGASRPGRPHHTRSAHQVSSLGRYRAENDAESLAGIVMSGFAAWSILELIGMSGVPSAIVTAMVVTASAYVLVANSTAAMLGVLGSLATIGKLLVHSECRDTTSARGILVFAAVVATSAIVFSIVRLAPGPIWAPLPHRLSGGAWALVTFGLIDVAAFVVNPQGLDIWAGTPRWAAPAVLGLIVVIAAFAGYAPQFVLRLTALAVVVGNVFLAAAAADVLPTTKSECENAIVGVGFSVVFALFVAAGIGFRRPERN
jgi:hypothetical protein